MNIIKISDLHWSVASKFYKSFFLFWKIWHILSAVLLIFKNFFDMIIFYFFQRYISTHFCKYSSISRSLWPIFRFIKWWETPNTCLEDILRAQKSCNCSWGNILIVLIMSCWIKTEKIVQIWSYNFILGFSLTSNTESFLASNQSFFVSFINIFYIN